MGYFHASGEARALARRYGIDVDRLDLDNVARRRFTRITAGQAPVRASYADPDLEVDDIVALEVERAKHGKPWAAEGLARWLIRTDRIHASSASFWDNRHRTDPAAVEATARQLHPFPEVRIAAAALDSAGVAMGPDTDAEDEMLFNYPGNRHPITAERYPAATRPVAAATRWPQVDASPPRTSYPNAVEELRASHPELVAEASRGGPAPTMFASGDQPASTASGIDPAVLRGLPWMARLAGAWAPSLVEAHAIVEEYSDREFGEWTARQNLSNNPAVRDYIGRVNSWAATSGLDAR